MKTCSKCRVEKEITEFNRKSCNKKDGLCSECKSCRRWYRQTNKEVLAERQKTYYQTNKEVLAERQKAYNKANKEVIAKRQKTYYQTNKEVLAEKKKEYCRANPHIKAAGHAKRRASKLQATPSWFENEKEQIKALYKEAIRLTKETGIQYHVDHYYPLISEKGSGLHCLANLRIITATENLAKNNTWPED